MWTRQHTILLRSFVALSRVTSQACSALGPEDEFILRADARHGERQPLSPEGNLCQAEQDDGNLCHPCLCVVWRVFCELR